MTPSNGVEWTSERTFTKLTGTGGGGPKSSDTYSKSQKLKFHYFFIRRCNHFRF